MRATRCHGCVPGELITLFLHYLFLGFVFDLVFSSLQLNGYLQTSIQLGKGYKALERAAVKEKSRAEKEAKEWEAKFYAADDQASSYKGKYLALEARTKNNESVIVDHYLNSDTFLEFIDGHDDQLRPEYMTMGWDKAIGAVSRAHPGVVDPADFASPDWALAEGGMMVHASGSGMKAISQTSGSGSKGTRRALVPGSKGAMHSVSLGFKGGASCVEPVMGAHRASSSSSSSSAEASEEESGEEESDEEEEGEDGEE